MFLFLFLFLFLLRVALVGTRKSKPTFVVGFETLSELRFPCVACKASTGIAVGAKQGTRIPVRCFAQPFGMCKGTQS